jgi:hypothetical protein
MVHHVHVGIYQEPEGAGGLGSDKAWGDVSMAAAR